MIGYYANKALFNMPLLLKVAKNSVVKGYHVFLLQVVCQKRKPKIDSLFLQYCNTSSGNIFFIEIQVTAGYCCSRLPCIQQETMLLHGTGVSGFYVFNALDYQLLLLKVTVYFH